MYKILFENENILAVEKPQGTVTEPDEGDALSLIEEIQRDKGQNCELCHRLDRNTGGILFVSKTPEINAYMEEAMKKHLLRKYYTAVVIGKFDKKYLGGMNTLKAYHFKDAKKGMVYIYDTPRKLAKEIVTKFRVLSYDEKTDTSRIEVLLITGRTHQIRAQFAHLGHPVAGDGKYGFNRDNKKLPYRYQALWSSRTEIAPEVCARTGLPGVLTSECDFR